ncbi:hypothetical protein CDIK_3073 [Cucumispora dikerogammari]|nr:hypothetical protein CDIK_3073 [Cucumispora dikerogammari]
MLFLQINASNAIFDFESQSEQVLIDLIEQKRNIRLAPLGVVPSNTFPLNQCAPFTDHVFISVCSHVANRALNIFIQKVNGFTEHEILGVEERERFMSLLKLIIIITERALSRAVFILQNIREEQKNITVFEKKRKINLVTVTISSVLSVSQSTIKSWFAKIICENLQNMSTEVKASIMHELKTSTNNFFDFISKRVLFDTYKHV